MLIAQAQVEAATLITVDSAMHKYDVNTFPGTPGQARGVLAQ